VQRSTGILSTTEYKVVLRAPLPDVKSNREHLEWFRANVGEPPLIEEDEEDEEDFYLHFSYEIDQNYHRLSPTKPYLRPCVGNGVYGVEMILAYAQDYPEMFKTTAAEVAKLEAKLQAMPGVSDQILFLSYGWYNGGDEPIHWE